FFFFYYFLMHLRVEEQILFPAIKELNKMKNDTEKNSRPAFSSVLKSIPVLQKEHLASAKDLESFRSLTNGYTLPADACETQRYLFRKMREFEDDLFMHVHLENNILFPKGLALTEKLTQKENRMDKW
ncbi:MAG: hemerythrin domain-containing protein, partial [Calditrichaeota bacterium]|nr:hemerythrin domain-containing protein [Calditrichota bacterium]